MSGENSESILAFSRKAPNEAELESTTMHSLGRVVNYIKLRNVAAPKKLAGEFAV
jgi:hypothetical protein